MNDLVTALNSISGEGDLVGFSGEPANPSQRECLQHFWSLISGTTGEDEGPHDAQAAILALLGADNHYQVSAGKLAQ